MDVRLEVSINHIHSFVCACMCVSKLVRSSSQNAIKLLAFNGDELNILLAAYVLIRYVSLFFSLSKNTAGYIVESFEKIDLNKFI